jgi:hypothetical protein
MSGKIVSDEALTQIFRSMKNEFVTETQIKNIVTEQKQGINFIQRNTTYHVDDLVHHPQLKKGLWLKCIRSGTTGPEDPIE